MLSHFEAKRAVIGLEGVAEGSEPGLPSGPSLRASIPGTADRGERWPGAGRRWKEMDS